jgi:hypothetical protein
MRKNTDGKKRFSNNSFDTDSLSQQSEYTPSPKPVRRQVSMATRRRSQLLYLEKYGLNQPGWHASQDDYELSSQHDSINEPATEYPEEPEYITPTPVRTNKNLSGMKRPVSIRNFVQITISQKRPINYIKPQKSFTNQSSIIPSEFIPIQKLVEDYSDKVYTEGYLFKRNDLNSNGTSCGTNKIWNKCYVELCGPVLTLWDTESTINQDVFPQYINITDSTVNIENRLTAETKSNLFSLNSAGANRFLLQAEDAESLHHWILAIRLSCFECARIQEIYTKAFIHRPQYITQQLLVIKENTATTTEGFVQVRFPGATGWKKFWAVVSNRRTEKKLFNKKIVPTDGQIMFFESKKAKYPMMTLENVAQVYTVYPESPQLINIATLFKIEGSLYKSKPNGHQKQLISASSSALVMTSNTSELVQWLVGCFDAFKLYGRPDLLLEDSQNPKSLSFAGDKPQGRLFLELSEVLSVDSGYGSSLLSNKKEFSAILLDKILRGVPFAIRTYNIVGDDHDTDDENDPLTVTNSRRSSINQAKTNSMMLVQQPTHLRTVTCASDVSDEEDNDGIHSGEESDSDESLFKLGTKPSIATNTINKKTSKPMTPNTSKSSSDNSEVSPATIPANNSTTDFFLPPVTDMTIDNSFSSSVLHHFNSNQKNPSKITVSSSEEVHSSTSESEGSHKPTPQKPFYAQLKSHSMVPLSQTSQQHLPWPMYGSTASVVMGDYPHNHSNNNMNKSWDTASLDANMMLNDSDYFSNQAMDTDEDDGDDDIPIANHKSNAKKREHYARSTGQPFIQVSHHKNKNARSSVPLSVISEKDQRVSRKNSVDEQMMARERMMLEQQRQQQQILMQQVNETIALTR